jgi:hypothetical protein
MCQLSRYFSCGTFGGSGDPFSTFSLHDHPPDFPGIVPLLPIYCLMDQTLSLAMGANTIFYCYSYYKEQKIEVGGGDLLKVTWLVERRAET